MRGIPHRYFPGRSEGEFIFVCKRKRWLAGPEQLCEPLQPPQRLSSPIGTRHRVLNEPDGCVQSIKHTRPRVHFIGFNCCCVYIIFFTMRVLRTASRECDIRVLFYSLYLTFYFMNRVVAGRHVQFFVQWALMAALIPKNDAVIIHTKKKAVGLCELSTAKRAHREEECAICLGTFVRRQYTARTPCGHLFHRRCLFRWYDSSLSCPVCRAVVVDV